MSPHVRFYGDEDLEMYRSADLVLHDGEVGEVSDERASALLADLPEYFEVVDAATADEPIIKQEAETQEEPGESADKPEATTVEEPGSEGEGDGEEATEPAATEPADEVTVPEFTLEELVAKGKDELIALAAEYEVEPVGNKTAIATAILAALDEARAALSQEA